MKIKYIYPESWEKGAQKVLDKMRKEGKEFIAKHRRKPTELINDK